MNVSRQLIRPLGATALALVLAFGPALAQAPAQAPKEEFQPQVGQAGKDVIWVPTSQVLVYKMLEVAGVTSDDFVVDLGSGDGRTVITAAKRGARALGIEYNPQMVELSRRIAEREGVADRAQFVRGDIFETDFSEATVVTMFLLSTLNLRLRPTILNMKPGTRVVSNTFDMGDWSPDRTITAEDCRTHCTGYFWIVPAKVEGAWTLPQGELVLEQKYQMLTGTLKRGTTTTPVKGRLAGNRITFTAGTLEFTGEVKGNTIQGTSREVGPETRWQATRAQ